MENNTSFLLRKPQWSLQMDKEHGKNPEELETTVAVEEIVEKRDIRANLLAARKKQLLRRKRGYGRLPSSLRR